MNKELLIETRQFTPKPVRLIEGMGNSGNVFVEGILATVEVKNGNGRYYKKELWDREIENSFILNATLIILYIRILEYTIPLNIYGIN
jgi:hypothetical protein